MSSEVWPFFFLFCQNRGKQRLLCSYWYAAIILWFTRQNAYEAVPTKNTGWALINMAQNIYTRTYIQLHALICIYHTILNMHTIFIVYLKKPTIWRNIAKFFFDYSTFLANYVDFFTASGLMSWNLTNKLVHYLTPPLTSRAILSKLWNTLRCTLQLTVHHSALYTTVHCTLQCTVHYSAQYTTFHLHYSSLYTTVHCTLQITVY